MDDEAAHRPASRDLRNAQPLPGDMTSEAMVRLYREMVLLRKFELAAQVACRKGETPGFLHLYIGQEATAVGVCAHLKPSDWVTSTHRGHGHALAKGMDPRVLMAELYGKHDGCCGGRGGTMHLYDPDIGLFGTNGLVGGGIPSAVGAAIAAKHRGTDGVAVAFFGDGATNHAAFHEALNFAGVRRAPAVLVCENNLYATATALSSVTLNPEIASRAAAYGVPGVAVDGNDVVAVWQATQEAVRAGAPRRRADADRGQDLPHRRPSRGRSGHRHLPDAGGGRCLGEKMPGRDLPPPHRRGLRDRHRPRARRHRRRDRPRSSRPRSSSPATRRNRSPRPTRCTSSPSR